MTKKRSRSQFMLCIDNKGYPAALEMRKVYRTIRDPASEARGLMRVIDESGEDYLYPAKRFVAINLPSAATGAFAEAGRR